MLFLLDKSAHERARRDLGARRAFETLAVTGLLATCAMVELEVLFSARKARRSRPFEITQGKRLLGATELLQKQGA